MLTEITVENRIISGFKKINMIVGHPTHIHTITRPINFNALIYYDFFYNIHYTDIEDHLMEMLETNQHKQLFLTNQSLDAIKIYHTVVMCNPKYADDCTFMNIGRSQLMKDNCMLLPSWYTAEELGVFIRDNLEVR